MYRYSTGTVTVLYCSHTVLDFLLSLSSSSLQTHHIYCTVQMTEAQQLQHTQELLLVSLVQDYARSEATIAMLISAATKLVSNRKRRRAMHRSYRLLLLQQATPKSQKYANYTYRAHEQDWRRAERNIHNDYYCTVPRFNDYEFIRHFRVTRNIADTLLFTACRLCTRAGV